MSLFRRFGLFLAVGLCAAVLAGPAFGARPVGLPNTATTAHFAVHYQTDPTSTYAATQPMATLLAALGERAYASAVADGFAPPMSDGALGGDSRTDIYIVDLSATEALAFAIPDNSTAQDSGYILVDGTNPEGSFTAHTIAHELFHLIQFNVWATGGASDGWLYEGSAEWMGFRATGYDFSGGVEFGPNWLSLDCSDPQGGVGCDLEDGYVNGGYSRWPFFEYLGEKFGASFVKDAFAQAAAGGTSATAGLSAALAAKGSSIADTYNAWSTVDMTGGYTLSALQGSRPTPDGTFATGEKSATFLNVLVPVDHLATSYLALTRGSGSSDNPCYAATMTLTVTIPSGTSSKPTFFWDVKGSAAVPLSINGSTATATIPWDTCTWPTTQGFLSLPNASTTVDGADFKVTGSLTVDYTNITTATPPPALVTLPGVVPVPATAVAPTIEVFGPELLKLGSTDKELRLIVQSSGEGLLQAQIGSIVLGSQTLRGGNNDVRFTLPQGLLQTFRRSASAGNLLTLTPVSTGGTATGQAVTRKVDLAVAKPKAKPKPAAKKKTKSGK